MEGWVEGHTEGKWTDLNLQDPYSLNQGSKKPLKIDLPKVEKIFLIKKQLERKLCNGDNGHKPVPNCKIKCIYTINWCKSIFQKADMTSLLCFIIGRS